MTDAPAIEWPSFCDLCEEYTTTAERCSQCGHRLRPIERAEPAGPSGRPLLLAPFDEAAAELRAVHRAALAELAAWSLAQERTVDLDVAALCLDVLERERTEHGIHLDRRSVNGIMWASMRNEAVALGTSLPKTWIQDLWTVLRFCVATGRVSHDSDPESALLEPLQCYGGLADDGRPRPDGIDVDFFYQCYLPHDPSCPPDMVQISLGHDWSARDDVFEYVALGHGVPRSVDVPLSAFEPLARLARRSRAQQLMFPFFLDLFDHIGTLPAERSVPELWLYRFTGSHRKGWPLLALDEHGGAWQAVRYRGRRQGFRWKPVSDRSAAHLCGVASWEFDRAHREYERRNGFEGRRVDRCRSTGAGMTRSTTHAAAPLWRYRSTMPSIQVKDVPDDVHATLRSRAAAAGMSLQEYLLARLVDEARTPTLDEVLERAGGRAGGKAPLRSAVKAVRRDRDAR